MVTAPLTESLVACPIWKAPECILGQPYDEKVDVYSLGIILWEVRLVSISPCSYISYISLIASLVLASDSSLVLWCDALVAD